MMKFRFGLGGVLMILGMMMSDRCEVLAIYLWAAMLHEVGHLTAAYVLNLEVKEIKFDFAGAHIRTGTRLESYTSEIILALSGPFVSIASFVFSLFAAKSCGISAEGLFVSAGGFLSGEDLSRAAVGSFFAVSSLIQGLTNLLPASGFDGGRALYCFTALLSDSERAQGLVSYTGLIVSVFLWVIAMYLMIKVAGGIGIFVFAAGIFANSGRLHAYNGDKYDLI